MPQTNPHFSPILQHASALNSQQRRLLRQIAFWTLFAYLELFVFDAAARDLLVATVVAASVAAVFRRTELGRRFSFVTLHLAILTSMTLQLVRQPSAALTVDTFALASLAALELSNRKSVLLLLIGVEHLGALFLSPWSKVATANTSAVISAHVVARAAAAVLVFAIAARAWFLQRSRNEPQVSGGSAFPVASQPSRPLTVAEWEAREASRR